MSLVCPQFHLSLAIFTPHKQNNLFFLFSSFLPISNMTEFTHLLATNYKKLIAQYLEEDVPSFDYGGYVVGEDEKVAILYCKAEGVLAGVPLFNEVFKQLGCRQVVCDMHIHLIFEITMGIYIVWNGLSRKVNGSNPKANRKSLVSMVQPVTFCLVNVLH